MRLISSSGRGSISMLSVTTMLLLELSYLVSAGALQQNEQVAFSHPMRRPLVGRATGRHLDLSARTAGHLHPHPHLQQQQQHHRRRQLAKNDIHHSPLLAVGSPMTSIAASSNYDPVQEPNQQVPAQLPIVVSSSDNSYVSASPILESPAAVASNQFAGAHRWADLHDNNIGGSSSNHRDGILASRSRGFTQLIGGLKQRLVHRSASENQTVSGGEMRILSETSQDDDANRNKEISSASETSKDFRVEVEDLGQPSDRQSATVATASSLDSMQLTTIVPTENLVGKFGDWDSESSALGSFKMSDSFGNGANDSADRTTTEKTLAGVESFRSLRDQFDHFTLEGHEIFTAERTEENGDDDEEASGADDDEDEDDESDDEDGTEDVKYPQVDSSLTESHKQSPPEVYEDSSNKEVGDFQVADSYLTRPATIIKTKESIGLGATFINYTIVTNLNACLIECWITDSCDTAIYQETPVDFHSHLPDMSQTSEQSSHHDEQQALHHLSRDRHHRHHAPSSSSTHFSPSVAVRRPDEWPASSSSDSYSNSDSEDSQSDDREDDEDDGDEDDDNLKSNEIPDQGFTRRDDDYLLLEDKDDFSPLRHHNSHVKHHQKHSSRRRYSRQAPEKPTPADPEAGGSGGFYLCYLFQCAKADGFKCQFSAHNYYVSSRRRSRGFLSFRNRQPASADSNPNQRRDVQFAAPTHYSKIITSPENHHTIDGRRRYHDTHLASISIGQEERDFDHGTGNLNGAIIAVMFGFAVTGMLIVIVGHKMRSIRQRLAYKSRRRSLVPDTDFLINTIPIDSSSLASSASFITSYSIKSAS